MDLRHLLPSNSRVLTPVGLAKWRSVSLSSVLQQRSTTEIILSLAKYVAEFLKRSFSCCCWSGERCSGTGGRHTGPGWEVEGSVLAMDTTSRTPMFCPKQVERLWPVIVNGNP